MKTLQIAKQLQSDGPQCENVKTSSISSSKVYKIIKRFRTSGENLCSALKTTSWVQKDFQKSSSVNTVSFTEVKALSCKENVACEDDPEMLLSS